MHDGVMLSSLNRADRAADALRELVTVRGALDALEAQLVATLRADGFSWVQLGPILGLTPQGAGKRHRAGARRLVSQKDKPEPFIPVRRR